MSIAILDAPVTFDNGEANTSTTTKTNTVVTNASNRLAIVCATCYDTGTPSISSVTLGAQSFTRGAHIGRQGSDYNFVEIWWLVAPTVGTTATLTITASENTQGLYGAFATFSDVKQTSTVDGTDVTDSGAGSDDPETMNITTSTYGCLIIDALNGDGGAGSPLIGQTTIGAGGSYRIVTDPGTFSVGRSQGVNNSFVHVANAFKTATVPTSSGLLVMF